MKDAVFDVTPQDRWPLSARHARLIGRLSGAAALFAVVVGALVLSVGWLGGVQTVLRILPAYPAMVPETALSLILGGAGLLALQWRDARAAARTLGLLMLLVVAHGEFAPSRPDAYRAGDAMSIGTALAVLLVAVSLLMRSASDEFQRPLRIGLETLGLFTVCVPLLGYLFDTGALFANPVFTAMSLPTALCLAALFLALLFSEPDKGWVRVLLAPELGSRMLRRMLPLLVLVPLLVAGVALALAQRSVGGGDYRLSLLGLFAVAAVGASAIWFAHQTNLSERRAVEVKRTLRETELARQASELALSRSQKVEALGNLVGGVAHDFNNTLTVILGNLELLDAGGDEVTREACTKEAMEAANHAAHLTRQLLAYGRKSRLEALPNNLDDLSAATLTMFRRICPANIAIHTDCNAARAMVLLDGANFQQALLNVLINARDAMPEGGAIFLSSRTSFLAAPALAGYGELDALTPGTYVKLVVRDTGTGMDPKTLARAEEPFFTTKPVGEGTGLGLSAVSGFCRQSGGGLKITSEPGAGTTVTLAFPLSGQIASIPNAPLPVPVEGSPAPRRILVVDDEVSVTRVMARQLQMDGHSVRIAQNAEQALAILEVEPLPDLIITDLVMPGEIQGHRLAEIIRERYPDARVLLMSGYESARRRSKMTRIRPMDFLQKPVDRHTLRSAVARAMEMA